MTQEFIPLKQNGNTCARCTIAMFAKIPVEYVTNNMPPRGQKHCNWWNIAWYFGLQLYADKIKGIPPNDGKWYFVRFRYTGKHTGHVVGWKDGYVYCSSLGKYKYEKRRGEIIDYHIGFLNQP